MDVSDLLWDSEISPDGGAIVHRSTQGPNAIRIETVRGSWRQMVKGGCMCAILALVLLYVAFIGGGLLLLMLAMYDDISHGPGAILVVLMEIPLLVGAFLPLTATTYVRGLRPLLAKEVLEVDGDTFIYTEKMPWLLQPFYYGRYTPLQLGGDAAELCSIELLSYPPDQPRQLFVAAGIPFGAALSTPDAEWVCSSIQVYLRSLNLPVEDHPDPHRKPLKLTGVYDKSTDGDMTIDFPKSDMWRLIVGFLSLWMLPLAIGVPMVYYRIEVNKYGDVETADQLFAPLVVWGIIHVVLYTTWFLLDLTAVRLRFIAGAHAIKLSRTLAIVPGVRMPFIVMDGSMPRFQFSRSIADISEITLETVLSDGREIGKRICLHFGHQRTPLTAGIPNSSSPSYPPPLPPRELRGSNQDHFLLPVLPYHETHWLKRQLEALSGHVTEPVADLEQNLRNTYTLEEEM